MRTTANPITTLADAMALALLASPGDEVTRLALADLREEEGKSPRWIASLRRPGRWELDWERSWAQWAFVWCPRADWTTHERFHTAALMRIRRKLLPRCACGKRAHVAFAPVWVWCCDREMCIHAADPKGCRYLHC